MNKRKPADYSALYKTLDKLMAQKMSETELCYEIGKAVCSRSEKCAAVMASEYLRERYPEMTGFSPCNMRRMREFYRAYENEPTLLKVALQIKWTLNVIILEACETAEEKCWYLRQVYLHKWKKSELVNELKSQAWQKCPLDLQANICYTEKKEATQENERNEKDPLYLSR